MIYVQNLQFVRNVQSSKSTIQAVFELRARVDERVMRRLPLACFLAESKTIGSYVEMLTTKENKGREFGGLNLIAVRRTRGEGVLQYTRPSKMFCQAGYMYDLSRAEIERAPRMSAQYKLGHQLTKTVDIPCALRYLLWRKT